MKKIIARMTPAKERVLRNLSMGREPSFGLSGRSAFGGHAGTMQSLVRDGLITSVHGDTQLTEKGRAVLESL